MPLGLPRAQQNERKEIHMKSNHRRGSKERENPKVSIEK